MTLSIDEYTHLGELYTDRVLSISEQYPGYQEAWQTLSSRILAEGGVLVVPPLERSRTLGSLLARGKKVSGEVRFEEGEPCQCHYNAAVAWLEDRVEKIGTGFGLSDDGLWREHSWGVGTKGDILESTEVRDVYWGIALEGDEAWKFSLEAAPNEFDQLLGRVWRRRMGGAVGAAGQAR